MMPAQTRNLSQRRRENICRYSRKRVSLMRNITGAYKDSKRMVICWGLALLVELGHDELVRRTIIC